MKRIIPLLLIVMLLSSCKIFDSSRMLRTPKNYPYANPAEQNVQQEYRLGSYDILTFFIYSNEGEKLLYPETTSANKKTSNNGYLIEFDGMIKLPKLGRVNISGMTIREAEQYLEQLYSVYFNDPYVKLQVNNIRVTVFTGGDNTQVVTIENQNTTLLEVLAQVGGIQNGRAHQIKVIRGNPNNPEVFLIDLSTIEGLKNADMTLQANDVIYVEPKLQLAEKSLNVITPYLSLVTSVILIIGYFKTTGL